MFNALLGNTTVPLLHQMARFAERRQDVLAGNIANISTPEYQMRDLPVSEFQAALEATVSSRVTRDAQGVEQWQFSPPRASSLSPSENQEKKLAAAAAAPVAIMFNDGNNRGIEHEIMEMTRNSMQHAAAIELLKMQFNRLEAVISGRV